MPNPAEQPKLAELSLLWDGQCTIHLFAYAGLHHCR